MNNLRTLMTCALALTVGAVVAATGDSKGAKLGTETLPVWQELPSSPTATYWGGAAPAVEGGSFAVDDSTYTRGTGSAASVVVCNFTLTASYLEDLTNIDMPSNPQTGFCIVKPDETTPAGFKAYVGGNWIDLKGATVPAADASYTLKINLDYVNQKIQFVVGSSVLSYNGATWFANNEKTATDVSSVAFVGSGKVALIGRATNTIVSEEIVVPAVDGKTAVVEFTEAQINQLKEIAKTEGSIEAAMAAEGKNGASNLENIALFGKTDVTAENKPRVEGAATEQTPGSDKVAIKVAGLPATLALKGAVATYTLLGKTATGDEFVEVASNTDGEFAVLATTEYRTFKVQVSVSFKPSNN